MAVDISEARRLAAHLTARERECLVLLIEGLGTRAMTLRLGVSTTTVRSHVQGLLTKLGVHSRLEAAAFAVRYDLVEHDQNGPEGRTKTG
ncbi:MAG: helix-turn-helix domain-containing protein [Pseudonocardiaceae bacterium]